MTRQAPRGMGVLLACAFGLVALSTAGAQRVDLPGAARDTPVAAGGEIAGTVVTTTAAPGPLARVLVTLSGSTLKASRTVVTDEQGRFAFKDLPPGRFSLVAARAPFVTTAFGARRPGRPGTPIDLVAGQRVTGITIALVRGAAITGMIRTAIGEPAAGIQVDVSPLDVQASPVAPSAVTDDRGIYRAFGLPPGKYVVTAGVTASASQSLTQFSDAEMDALLAKLERRLPGASTVRTPLTPGTVGPAPSVPVRLQPTATYGYAPIYYPGTADPDQAATIALVEDQERTGVDLDLQLVRTLAIEGRVTTSGGTLPSGIQLTLTRSRRVPSLGPVSATTMRTPDATGAFRFTGLLPGQYRIIARAVAISAAAPATQGTLTAGSGTVLTVAGVSWGLADVALATEDVSSVALALQPGLRLSGRMVFDPSAQPVPADLAAVRVRLVDVTGGTAFTPAGTTRTDGTFAIDGLLPGTYTMMSLLADTPWQLRSVMVDGHDILDLPLELGPSGDVSGAVVTFTDQRTELSGVLQHAANVPAPEHFVVVFPADRALWRPASRRTQFARPGTDGRYMLRNLPEGDYLIAALTDMEPADLLDGSFIEQLVPGAIPVRLRHGEKRTLDLRIGR